MSFYSSVVLADSPMAYYRMDASSGTSETDLSGNGWTGTISATGITYSQVGALWDDPDKALLFNGSTGKIDLPAGLSVTGLAAFTVECWMKMPVLTGAGASPRIISSGFGTGQVNGFELYAQPSGGGIQGVVGNGTTAAYSGGTVALVANTWYHAVLTYDGTTVRYYQNGVVSTFTSALTGTIGTQVHAIGIAYEPAGPSGFINATLDEVAFYNTALSAAKVLTHYQAGISTVATLSGVGQLSGVLTGPLSLASTFTGTSTCTGALSMPQLAFDTFVRANQTGWGQSSTVGSWVRWNGGGGATISITGNKGVLTGDTSVNTEYIGTTSAAGVDLKVRFIQSAATAACGLIARGVPASTNFYAAQLKNGTLSLNSVATGTFTPFASTAFTATAGSAYWIRYRLIGSTHLVKIWADGTAEPAAWQLTATDATYSAAGQFGITMQLALVGDNVQFDQFSAYLADWSTPLPPPIYYGVYEPPPYTSTAGIATFETLTGTTVSFVHAYCQWGAGTTTFNTTWADAIRAHGSIPLLTWNSWDLVGPTNATYKLTNITAGNFDTYITTFALAIKAWGHPLFLRLNHEMNGPWYPWCVGINGNIVSDYVPMWKHVHDIFTAQGVTNVTWVWCPADEGGGNIYPITGLYPGDAYVDWLGVDGYNFGGETFGQVYTPIYNDLVATSNKPIMIAEFGAQEEAAGVKGWWYYDMLQVQLPYFFPKIRAAVFFDSNDATHLTLVVNSSTDALTKFIAGIQSGYYIRNAPGSIQPLSLYGSNVPASSPTSAGNSAITTGGVEIAAVTTAPASGSGYVECFALGGTSTVNASLPAPSGKGWTLDSALLEGQRLVAGNWGASVAVSDANGGGPVNSYTLRFWQRSSGGSYAAIGSLVLSASQVISTLRVVKTFLAAAMPQTDFAVGDKLYIDFFINANGWASDVLSVYLSNSGSAGVAGDLEVDTAGYTPSGTAGVVTSYVPRALSALLVITSTALLDTLSGVGTLTGTISALSVALSVTLSGGGVLSGQLTGNLALPAATLPGASSLSGLSSLATSLATSQFTGSSTLAASVLARTVLTSQLAGIGTLASSFQLATSLAGTLAGTGQFAGLLTANLTLAGIVLPAVGAFSGTVGLTTALVTTMAGGGQLAGTMALTSNLSTTLSGAGQLTALLTASLALPGMTLAGRGTLAGTISTATPVALSTTIAGGGALNGPLTLATQLPGMLAGVGALSSTMTASTTLASMTLPGSGALIGAVARSTVLSTSMAGAGTLGGVPSAALALSGTSLVGVGALSATLTGAGGLVGTLSGGSTLAGSLSAALQLSGVSLAGVGALSATVQGSTVLGTTLAGTSTLAGAPGARTALGATLAGASTLVGTPALAAALTGTLPSVGTLAGIAGRSTALSVALPGSGQLIAVPGAQTTMSLTLSGIGAAAFTLFLRTSLSVTLAGAGSVTTASVSYQVALALSLSGLASLSGSLTVPVLAYLSATWLTRDGQVVWKTRDEQEATWVTRDLQAMWKIRS